MLSSPQQCNSNPYSLTEGKNIKLENERAYAMQLKPLFPSRRKKNKKSENEREAGRFP